MEPLHKFMNSISPLSKESYEAYMGVCEKKKFTAGTVLLEIGTIPDKIHFIQSGIARSYSISDKGVEYIRSLISTNNILASTEALIKKTPSTLACQCLTDCELLEVDYDKLFTLFQTKIEVALWYLKTAELHYAHVQKINDELLTLNATERYLRLQKRIPNIDNRINQYHIAANLGITPIQLSRIRKKLYSK